MPSAMISAVDLSAVALAKLLPRSTPLPMATKQSWTSPDFTGARRGLPYAQHGPRPRSEGSSQRFPPDNAPPSSHRGHPVSSLEDCPCGGSLSLVPAFPGGEPCLREDLGLERARLREENARADSRGAWNPS